MAAGSETVLGYLRRLVLAPQPGEATDAALLDRFICDKDERAFTALVERHGPLVLRVCRRVLGDVHDAEDAFQAAFLVLARRAASVHPREGLTAWLHGVARRVALKALSRRARKFHEARPPAAPVADPRPDPLAELSARELLLMVDEEVQRLPQVYRLPVILCCLEGHSLEEAARQLGWTPGSVKGRLQRGRARLHHRLLRRGLTLPAVLAAAAASQGVASAAVVAPLVECTVRGALAYGVRPTAAASGVSAQAAVLAGETLRGMALARLKIAAALMLGTCLVTTGFLYRAAQATPTAAPQGRSSPFSSQNPVAEAAPAALVKNQPKLLDEADAPIEVSGLVLDAEGKPFAGAKLYLGYTIRRSAPDIQLPQPTPLLRGSTGADGRFQFTFTNSDLDARCLDDSRPAVVAVADGYGPDWAQIGDSEKRTNLSLKLVEDLPLNGRLLDQNRKPVPGARIRVLEVSSDSDKGVMPFPQGNSRRWRGPLPEQATSVATDADGRFRLTGLGRDRIVSLALDGQAIVHSTAVTRLSAAIPNAQPSNGTTLEYQTAPSQPLRGVVRDKATGKPVAGVRMSAQKHHPPAFSDENGHFEILGCPKIPEGYTVMAQPQTGQPYFAAKTSVPDRPGFDPLTVDIDLLGGIAISGRVTDETTGKPPRAGCVEYYPLFPNHHSTKLTHCPSLAASSSIIQRDGSYSLVVLPGPGVVCVVASPRNSYAVAVVDDTEVADFFRYKVGHNGSQRLQIALGMGARVNLGANKYNALSLINPDEGAESLSLNITLQPGRTLRGTVVGLDGQPLTGVEVAGLTAQLDGELLDGESFTITGLNPRCSRELLFRHRGKRLGKLLTIGGDETGPLIVQLDPCGHVLGRVVDKEGKPVAGLYLSFSRRSQSPEVVAETDRDGRFRQALLAGQKYSLWPSSYRRLTKDVGELEVESGRSIDLGDLLVGD
jgi:RNA polymerase sigma factor (sigma-70 family)